jgi:hypothetical protein
MRASASPCCQCGFRHVEVASFTHRDKFQTPDFLRLKRSNTPPLDTEHLSIRMAKETIQGDMKAIEEEMDHLKQHLQRLEKQHESLAALVDSSTQILSPLRHIPPEILAEVFQYVTQGEDCSNQALDVREGAPWVLARVSSEWRQVALGQPALWATIDLNLDQDFEFNNMTVDTAEEVLAEHLRRSKGYPLTIDLVHDGEDTIMTNAVLDALAPSAPRWLSAKFKIPYTCLDALHAVEGNLPLLEFVHLELEGVPVVGARSATMFSIAPRLQRVSLGSTMDDIVLPFEQLKEFSSTDRDTEKDFAVIQKCPHLRLFQLRDAYQTPLMHPSPVELLDVEEALVLNYHLMDTLRMPKLEHLTVHLASETNMVKSMLGMIERSGCALKIIRSCWLSDVHLPGLIELFTRMPSIRGIHVAPRPQMKAATTLMDFLAANPTVLPNLESFELTVQHWNPSWHEPFVNLVDRRSRGDGKLRKLSWFINEPPCRDEALVRIADTVGYLKREGLDITFPSMKEDPMGKQYVSVFMNDSWLT